MRDLDSINPPFAKPGKIIPYGFVLPFFMGQFGWSLADGASHGAELENNYIAIFALFLSVFSIICAPIPFIFKWDWKAKYFGVSLLCLGSAAGIGIFPFLSIAVYGIWPLWIRLIFLAAYILLIVWWCRRFVLLYRKIYNNEKLRKHIYIEEIDAVYYLQQGDKFAVEKKMKFAQLPPNIFFVISTALGFFLVPFMGWAKQFVGVPFTHIIVTVGAIPISLMCLGLATRGYLIFYYYPWKIKRETGKDVYVDMVSKAS